VRAERSRGLQLIAYNHPACHFFKLLAAVTQIFACHTGDAALIDLYSPMYKRIKNRPLSHKQSNYADEQRQSIDKIILFTLTATYTCLQGEMRLWSIYKRCWSIKFF
jgi:hypothetical protein